MPDDDLAPPAATVSPKRITCEFCECGLAGSGDVLKRSARAKHLMDLEEKFDAVTADLADARSSVTSLSQQLAAAVKELDERKKKGGLFS